MLFRGGVRSRLRAWVCGNCGYTELFVDDASLLWETYQRSQRDASEEGASDDDDAI